MVVLDETGRRDVYDEYITVSLSVPTTMIITTITFRGDSERAHIIAGSKFGMGKRR